MSTPDIFIREQESRTELCICEKGVGGREKGGSCRENGIKSVFQAYLRLHLTVTSAER
jgi:hypothetical protein